MSEPLTDEQLTEWDRMNREGQASPTAVRMNVLIQEVRRLRAALAEIPIDQATQEEYERVLAKERTDFLVATDRAENAETEVERLRAALEGAHQREDIWRDRADWWRTTGEQALAELARYKAVVDAAILLNRSANNHSAHEALAAALDALDQKDS